MKEKGFPLIESLMFDEHDMVKRAATECMCNMVLCDEVRMLFGFHSRLTKRTICFSKVTVFRGNFGLNCPEVIGRQLNP